MKLNSPFIFHTQSFVLITEAKGDT